MTGADGRIEVSREEAGGVPFAILTIARRAKLNALSSALLAGFVRAVDGLAGEAALRAIVVTGEGERAFAGGADIGEMAALAGPEAARRFIEGVHRACAAVRAAPMPVIARVNGYAFGAGLELAAACDLRIAADTATFAMPEVRLGVPSVVEAALLPGLIGWGRTRRLLLLGETIDASTALGWGLVEHVVPAADLDATLAQWVAALGASPVRTIAAQKRLMRAWEDLPLGEAVAAGVDAFARAYEGDEPRDAMRAFLERRRPPRG